jgi:hypothetical protein
MFVIGGAAVLLLFVGIDLRVQMGLGCLGAEEPPFSQGALQEFRDRLIAADVDRRVLERTVELAKATQAFDYRQLPKTLRVAIDSSPLEGAGRVEDTFNLLAHAARNVVRCAAGLLGWPDEQVCGAAGIPLLLESSIKRALDIDWNDAVEKTAAITTLTRQLDALQLWLERQLPSEIAQPPLKAQIDALVQIRTQDLEPDPQGGGSRMREGVAEDRQVSIADRERRHGRKSKRFNGFKRHIAADVDRGLILACAIPPANRPEDEAMPSLTVDMAHQGFDVAQLLLDRGYINSTLVDEVLARRGTIVCKPWKSHNGTLFPKSAFTLNIRNRTIECPNEQLQQRRRTQIQTAAGRGALRERTRIEHKLAQISQRQGNHAHLDLEVSQSVAMHFGTFQLTTEGIDDPVRALDEARHARKVPLSKFRTLGFGESLRLR